MCDSLSVSSDPNDKTALKHPAPSTPHFTSFRCTEQWRVLSPAERLSAEVLLLPVQPDTAEGDF